MEDLLELIVSATASGCIYALVALAYLLILRPTSVINFAVGEWAASGAFIGVAVLTPLAWPRLEGPYWLALLAVLFILGVMGWLVEVLTVRPLIRPGTSITSPILALLGVLVIFREGLTILFGADPLPSPPPFGFKRVAFGLFAGASQQFLIIAATLALFVAVWLFF